MEDEIKKYIDSVIPKNIPDKRKLLLSDELESHIYEKVDRYEEIGYTTEQSLKKALEEMGEDENTKKCISDGFDKLYHEKTWWAVATFAGILLFNFASFFVGAFVEFIDGSGYPEIYGTVSSSVMILAMFGIIAFAVRRKYEKMLYAIGVSNFIIAGSLLFCAYPQAAFWSFAYNIGFLADYTGSLLMPEFASKIANGVCFFGSICFVFAISVTCFILRADGNLYMIKEKTAKTVLITIGLLIAVTSVFNCIIYPKATEYEDDYYRLFFNYDDLSKESPRLYDDLKNIQSYNEATSKLKSAGYTNKEEYSKTLNKNDLKQFSYNTEISAVFDSSYDVWFNPNITDENNFIFVKNEANKITGLGFGDTPGEKMSDSYDFRFYQEFKSRKDNTEKCISDFKNLKKGDNEKDVMSIFGHEYGYIYSALTELNGDKKVTTYRIYVADRSEFVNIKIKKYYIEFFFENGVLKSGVMHDGHFPFEDIIDVSASLSENMDNLNEFVSEKTTLTVQ